MDRYGRGQLIDYWLVILSGNDTAAIWQYYNSNSRIVDTQLYEPENLGQLIWVLDFTHTDEITAHIPICYIYLPSPTDDMVRTIEHNHYSRKLEWHIFTKNNWKLKCIAPKDYFLWSNGKCQ